jgi:hypothetical protein
LLRGFLLLSLLPRGFVLTAPRTVEQLEENLAVLAAAPLSTREMSHWERFGDLVYGTGADSFETKWQ